jgi:plasmid replication initiation protein
MRKFFSIFFKKVVEMLEKNDSKSTPVGENVVIIDKESSLKVVETPEKKVHKKKTEVIPYAINPIRDVIDLMEFPFVALSKNRINPIIYESADKTKKVVISGHRGHFLASIYDWDIILIVAGKIQEILNNESDIPSCTISIPRHELLKALHKQDGKKQHKDLEKSLDRLQLTGISTTVNNKDYRHRAGFGFLDRWGYSERKNARETRKIQITLSPWLYELCCAQGGLLKSNISYFDITSGLKKFLYRTARKHAGNNKDGWKFSIEMLYEKSGSEREFKKFKSDLKAAVQDDDIPEHSMEWVEESGKTFVSFKRLKIHELERMGEECEKLQEKTFISNKLQ